MLSRATFGCALATFVASRCVLIHGLTPFFDGDTYKYLSGADALRSTGTLPPLFRDLPTTGGALHAVPGYAVLIEAVWMAIGRPSLTGVLVVQSLLSLLGLLAAADLARRWIGPWSAAAMLVVLASSPTLAWLEHLMMPDVLAFPLFSLAAWLIVVMPLRSDRGAGAAVNGALCGFLLAAEVLLRTASQFFVPIIVALALTSCVDRKSFLHWMTGGVLALALGLLPWMLHNHEVHGDWRLSASTGRNMYFSALWGDQEFRERMAGEYGIAGGANVASSFGVSNRTLEILLARGLSIAEADTEMRGLTVAAYRATPLAELIRKRFELVRGLFVHSSGPGEWLWPLRTHLDELMENRAYDDGFRGWTEIVMHYEFGPAAVEAQQRAKRTSDRAAAFFRWWVRTLTLEGVPLLAAYLFTMPLLLLLPRARACAVLVFAAPPLAYLVMFSLAGAPLYRYQAALHPFMLATVMLGTCAALARLTGHPRDSTHPSAPHR